jgi:hypothetical protein
MPTIKFSVRELDLEGEERLERAMMGITGVYGAVADHEARCLEVDFEDDVASLDELEEAARRAGFTTRLAS